MKIAGWTCTYNFPFLPTCPKSTKATIKRIFKGKTPSNEKNKRGKSSNKISEAGSRWTSGRKVYAKPVVYSQFLTT